jgi:hypothetical protein
MISCNQGPSTTRYRFEEDSGEREEEGARGWGKCRTQNAERRMQKEEGRRKKEESGWWVMQNSGACLE